MTADSVAPVARRRRGTSIARRPLWMLLPGGVVMTLIIVVPLLLAVYMSLVRLNQYTLRKWISAPFIGIENYVSAVTASPVLHAVGLSVIYSVCTMIICLPVGVAAALATQRAFAGRAVIRSLFLVPYVLPQFVAGIMWSIIFNHDGVVNGVLGAVGIPPVLWLSGTVSLWTLVIVHSWATWPFVYLLALAGLQAVPHEVHEAAALDGAGWWRKLRDVVLPFLKGPLTLAALVGLLQGVNNFTLPFVMFGVPAPSNVQVLTVLTYQTGFVSFQFGLSAAMAIFSLVLMCIPLFVYLRAVRLDVGEEAV